MSKGLLYRLILSIFIITLLLYSYLDKHNDLAELKIEIPKLVKEIAELEEENSRLQYEINCLENPKDLMGFLRQKEFSHLKQPLESELIILKKEKDKER